MQVKVPYVLFSVDGLGTIIVSQRMNRLNLYESAQRLEQIGVDILLMPCNTSHAFNKSLCESVHIPIINMID